MIFEKGERGCTFRTTSEHFSEKRGNIGVLATFALFTIGIRSHHPRRTNYTNIMCGYYPHVKQNVGKSHIIFL